MNTNTIENTRTNGIAGAAEIFALSDEQILEIEPETQALQPSEFAPANPKASEVDSPAPAATLDAGSTHASSASAVVTTEPQPGAPQSRPATPTGPFSATEDLKALGELYPGGLPQAKTAAERARTLDEFDSAYFGGTGNSPEQANAARAALAQRMLSENPAAFREMVFAGLRALENASAANPESIRSSSVAAPRTESPNPGAAGARFSASPDPLPATSAVSAQAAAYAVFERSANEDLERSVGASIERTIAHALPNLVREEGDSAGARTGTVPLRERLASSVRQDVEAALKSDRQLGEQIAQILTARRFDDGTRAQVVRLINDRAQQLVPGAARRVISEWTQSTLAVHRAKAGSTTTAAAGRELPPAETPSLPSGATAQNRREISPREIGAERQRSRSADSARNDRSAAASPRRLDYRKLSDEQILDL